MYPKPNCQYGGFGYQEILAPYLNKNGQYISATYDPDSEEQTTKDRYQSEKDRLSAKKNIYGNRNLSKNLLKNLICQNVFVKNRNWSKNLGKNQIKFGMTKLHNKFWPKK